MNGTNSPDREAQQRKPSPLVEVVADRLREVTAEAMADPDGAVAGAGYAEAAERRRAMRREVRRRDLEIARISALEASLLTTEYIAGRLPSWKLHVFEHVRDPLASLANLNRSMIQLTLAEDRFDESEAERVERVKAEAEAKVKADREAETARAYTDAQIRRADNKRQVHQTVRAVTIAGLKLSFDRREEVLADLFKELELEDVYDADPAETVAAACVRLGIAAGGVDLKPILERRAALAELARTHIEALRGGHPLDEDDETASGEAPSAFAHAANAQGPPH
jgi:hypothetical protein